MPLNENKKDVQGYFRMFSIILSLLVKGLEERKGHFAR